MSSIRAKSCHSCRSAKARCSLEVPCARCSKKSLECRYAVQTKRAQEAFREIRPAFTQVQVQDTGNPSFQSLKSFHHSCAPTIAEGSDFIALRALRPTGQEDESPNPSHQEHGRKRPTKDTALVVSYDTLSESLVEALPQSESESLYVDDGRSTLRYDSIDVRDALTLDPSQISFRNVLGAPQLMQRGRSLQQGSLTAKMVLSRLVSYCGMIADGKQLPPFIHGSSTYLTIQPSDDYHYCTNTILSQCGHNIKESYTFNDTNAWTHISHHVRQLVDEHESYNENEVLQALQATLLYSILCSQCSAPIQSQCSGLFVSSVEMLGKRLFSMVPWTLNVPITSRQQWTLVESIRRMACILYLIDLLLLLDADTPSHGNCDTFWNMPLPCHRELWQATSQEEWAALYGTMKKSSLTLGRLLLLRQSKRLDEVIAKAGGSAIAEELSEWCEKADDLSMLLWMALSIEGEGQSNGIEVGDRS